jgi:hypothetical protein
VLAVASTSVPSAEFVPGEVITVVGGHKTRRTVLDGDPDEGPVDQGGMESEADQ